jgi:hypothetical protein
MDPQEDKYDEAEHDAKRFCFVVQESGEILKRKKRMKIIDKIKLGFKFRKYYAFSFYDSRDEITIIRKNIFSIAKVFKSRMFDRSDVFDVDNWVIGHYIKDGEECKRTIYPTTFCYHKKLDKAQLLALYLLALKRTDEEIKKYKDYIEPSYPFLITGMFKEIPRQRNRREFAKREFITLVRSYSIEWRI